MREGGEKRTFGPPETPEEEKDLILERSKYLLEHIAGEPERHSIEHLTRLKTREAFDTELKLACGEIEEKRHGTEPLEKISVILIDLDNFKKINDTKGHDAGDEVLRRVSELLMQSVRPTDVVARFGGEELVILMRDAENNVAVRQAEHLRTEIEKLKFAEYPTLKVTASLGVCSADTSDGPTAAVLLKKADMALYSAKHAGRNRVEVFTENGL